MTTTRAILIAGPTASGKSALALALAARHRAVVINADSMQVYRELSVLTARPTAADEAHARHALYGHVGGGEDYSVGRWLGEVSDVLDDLARSGTLAVVTGGTGLYFKALLEGLSPIPAIPAEIRTRWRLAAAERGAASLHAELLARDPATAAKLRASDPQRLTRALEVLEATGHGLASWQGEKGSPVLRAGETLRFVESLDRETLYRRADDRLSAMMTAGALDEVRRLLDCGYAADRPVMRALGVAPLAAALRGEIAIETALADTRLATRHYIKRQITWLNRHMISWKHIDAQYMESLSSDSFTII